MASPIFNFSGIASGLDTNSMIEALMNVERNPIRLMQQRQATAQAKVSSWSSITTRVSALRTSINDLKTLDKFDDFVTATSGDEDALTVTSEGGAQTGTTAFTVTQLATSHQLVTDSDFSSSADAVGAGTLTITVGGVDTDIVTSSGTTVSNLAVQINDADIGVSASVIKVDDTTYKLVVAATETGADNVFTATGTQSTLTTFGIATTGVDAQLTMGDGAGSFVISRDSNTITDVIDGVEINLKTTTASAVTITVDQDIDGTIEAVKGFVNELTATNAEIQRLSNYDADAERAMPLAGDSTLRGITSSLVSEVTGVIDSLTGDYSYASSLGINYGADGAFSLDEDKLRTALEDDYDAVTRFFAKSGQTTDSRMSFSFSSDDTVAGAYEVVVTQAATLASVVGSSYSAPGSDITMTISAGGVDTDVTIVSGDDINAAITRINDALDDAGVSSLRASESGGAIKLGQLKYGSAGDFTVVNSSSLGLDGTESAQDVVGTIDGVAATGTGQSLLSESGDSDGLGITIQLTDGELTAAGGSLTLGDLTYARGLMGELSEVVDYWEGTDGSIARASDRWEDEISDFDDRIADFERRLERREATLRKQFTAMETALADLQGQSSFLSSFAAPAAEG